MSDTKQVTLLLTMLCTALTGILGALHVFELSEGSSFRDAAWISIALTAINAGLHAAITAITARSGGTDSNR